MLYSCNCGLYVRLLEQFLSCITSDFLTCVYTLHCQRKKVNLMQLFKKGTESSSAGTQLLTLTLASRLLLHFSWETVWELLAILFSPKSDKLRGGTAMLHLLKLKFADSSAWEVLLKAVLWQGRVLHS